MKIKNEYGVFEEFKKASIKEKENFVIVDDNDIVQITIGDTEIKITHQSSLYVIDFICRFLCFTTLLWFIIQKYSGHTLFTPKYFLGNLAYDSVLIIVYYILSKLENKNK